MPSRWLMNALVDYGLASGYRAEVATDQPCHLWLRWSRNKPQRHPRAKVVRGLALMGDVYYCFTAYNDIEQEEAGDTTSHTFIMSDWPACQTRWMYLWGEIGGEATPSESPIWGRHLSFRPGSAIVNTIALADQCGRWGGRWFTHPALSPPQLPVGRWTTQAHKVGAGLRFQNCLIPKYAQITDAKIWLTASWTGTSQWVNSRIRAENVGNAPDFYNITYPQFLTRRANGTGIINYDHIENWAIDGVYSTPSLNAGIGGVVNRPDWESGNSIVIIWDDFDHRSTWIAWNLRVAYAFAQSPAKAPVLRVYYNEWLLESVNP